MAINTWVPDLYSSAGLPVVRALKVQAGSPDVVYIGGDFNGTSTAQSLHAFVKCDDPGSGDGSIDTGLDLGFEAGDQVWDIALDSGDIYLAGSITIDSTQCSAARWTGSSFAYTVVTDGMARAIVVTPGGDAIIGGDFTEFHWSLILPYPTRLGLLAVDGNGDLLGWANDVLDQSGEYVGSLLFDGGVVWVCGTFTGSIQDDFLTNFASP